MKCRPSVCVSLHFSYVYCNCKVVVLDTYLGMSSLYTASNRPVRFADSESISKVR